MSNFAYLFRGRHALASAEWGQNLELAAGAIQEALCRMFERVARVLMARGGENQFERKEAP